MSICERSACRLTMRLLHGTTLELDEMLVENGRAIISGNQSSENMKYSNDFDAKLLSCNPIRSVSYHNHIYDTRVVTILMQDRSAGEEPLTVLLVLTHANEEIDSNRLQSFINIYMKPIILEIRRVWVHATGPQHVWAMLTHRVTIDIAYIYDTQPYVVQAHYNNHRGNH